MDTDDSIYLMAAGGAQLQPRMLMLVQLVQCLAESMGALGSRLVTHDGGFRSSIMLLLQHLVGAKLEPTALYFALLAAAAQTIGECCLPFETDQSLCF